MKNRQRFIDDQFEGLFDELYDNSRFLLKISNKDNYTYEHSIKVTNYAIMLGLYLGLSDSELEALKEGALLHDIGKIKVPKKILFKKGRLTEGEFAKIRKHPETGASMLKRLGVSNETISMVLHHHERFDGTGYPYGLEGVKIPRGARIIAVVDAFEAMTSNRPYREAYSVERALKEIKLNVKSQFDPDIANSFIELVSFNRSIVNLSLIKTSELLNKIIDL